MLFACIYTSVTDRSRLLSQLSYLDLVTPASKVAESLDGHAHVGLEGQSVHSSRVNGFDSGQLLLVLLHQVSQPAGGLTVKPYYETQLRQQLFFTNTIKDKQTH